MTLNTSKDILSNPEGSPISHEMNQDETINLTPTNSIESIKNDEQKPNDNEIDQSNDELMEHETLTEPIDDQLKSDDEQISIQQTINETINNVLEQQIEEKVNNKSPNGKKKDKDKDNLESPKKRAKSTPKKDDQSSKDSKSSLIRQPKLQINDKTLKKILKPDTNDLIFNYNEESANSSDRNHHQKFKNNDSSKLKTNNLNLMPVVNNVLSRSIAAIFKNSTINSNGEFNSYSALGFKGPRVKRVCRTFSDVYRGLPRAVFPTNHSTNNNQINKSSPNSSSSTPGRRKSKKLKNKTSSPSTSKSNSNSSFKEDDSTECSYDSDDLEINEYIQKNLKKEMDTANSKEVST